MASTPASTLRGVCAHCGTSPEKALRCSKCFVTMYCGKECQTAHWRAGHKGTCFAIANHAYSELVMSLGGCDTLSKLLHEAYFCADPHPDKRRPLPQALTPQTLDQMIALATANRVYSRALSALTVRALQCWQDPSSVEAVKRAYATKLLDMRAKDETEDRFRRFTATTAAAALLGVVRDWQELVKVSKECMSHLRDASLDTGSRMWVYQRLGSVLLYTAHETEEMGRELSLAAETCFRAALDLSTSGGFGIKVVGVDGRRQILRCLNALTGGRTLSQVAESKLLLGEVLFRDNRYEECVRVMIPAYEEKKADMWGSWSSGVALRLAIALCSLRRVGEARAYLLRAFEICQRDRPAADVRMMHLIELLYEIDFSTGRYQDAYELVMYNLVSNLPPFAYFLMLMMESTQAKGDQDILDLVDQTDGEIKAGQDGELLPLQLAQRLGPAFATREGRRLIAAGHMEHAEGWLQAAVDSARYHASRNPYAWGMEQRAMEPQEMLLGLLEARGTPEAMEKATTVRAELKAAAKARDKLQAQTLAEARDIIRSRAKRGRRSKKQTVPSSATGDVDSSEVTAAEDAQARVKFDAPTVGMGEEEEDLCSLCLDQMEPMRDAEEEVESPVCVQECGHRHHDACLDHMVEFQLRKGLRELECPMCRQPLLRVRRWCVEH